MIRKASRYDIPTIIKLLKHYRDAAPADYLQAANDEKHIESLLLNLIAGAGFVLLAEKDGQAVGMVISALIPNIWNPQARQCAEVAYWVEPEHRGGFIGHRLFKAFLARCERMREAGEIAFYSVSKMVNSPDLNYGRYGFRKLEETWIK